MKAKSVLMTMILILLGCLLTVGCGGGGGGGEGPTIPKVTINGKMNLPGNSGSDTVIIAGTQAIPLAEDNSFTAELASNSSQAVIAIKNDDLQGVAIIPDTSKQTNVTLDAKSTAEALLLLTPFAAQGTAAKNSFTMNIIKSLPEVTQLQAVIAENLTTIGKVADIENPDNKFTEAFSAAAEALFNNESFRQTSAWQINPGKASLLEIKEKTETSANNDFRAINHAKRYVDIYDGNTRVVTSRSLGLSTLYQPSQTDFTLNISGRSKITLKTYGPGKNNIPPLGSEDLNHLFIPSFRSITFDVFLPALNLVVGLSGSTDLGPIEELFDNVSKNEIFVGSILAYAANGDWCSVGSASVSKLVDYLLDDLVKKGLNSLIARYVAKEAATSVFVWMLLPIKLASAVTKVGDILLAVSAYDACSAVQEFELKTGSSGTGNLIWAKRAGGLANDWGLGVTALSDNSTVVTGYFEGSATFGEGEPNETTLNSCADTDIFIARYDTSGKLAWAKSVIGNGEDKGFGITALSDNSIIVTGTFEFSASFGHGEPNETTLNSYAYTPDIFIAKYNANGTLAWAKSAGGNGFDEGRAITALSDNTTVVTGNFTDSAIFGQGESNETTFISAGGFDIFIARFNTDGTLRWAKRAGGSGGSYSYDSGNAITVLSDNSTIVAGQFEGSATFGSGEPNEIVFVSDFGWDAFIARYNTDGTLAWAKRPRGTNNEFGNAITSCSDNSIVVTGGFTESTTFGKGESNETVLVSTTSGWNTFIARYDTGGALLWAKHCGGVWGDAITILSDNSTIVTGCFVGTTTFGQGETNEVILEQKPGGYSDIFIARYNSDGTLAWAKREAKIHYDAAVKITGLSDNSFVMTSSYLGSGTFGEGEFNETMLVSAGEEDVFIARFSQ